MKGKKGAVQHSSTSSSPSLNRHRVWLGVGITVAVLLVMALLFFGPGKDAVFGKAITTTDVSGRAGSGSTSSGTTSSGTTAGGSTAGTGTTGVGGTFSLPCLDVQAIPVPATGSRGTVTNQDKYDVSVYRWELCNFAGCTFQGFECPSTNPGCANSRDGYVSTIYTSSVTYNPANDVCVGTATQCIGNELGSISLGRSRSRPVNIGTHVYNAARRTVCQSNDRSYAEGCYFHDRGVNAPFDSSTSISADYVYDSCLPFGVEGEACTVSSVSGSWVYSYLPVEYHDYQPEFPPRDAGTGNRRIACCAEADACATIERECIPYDRIGDSDQFVCGSDNNWNECTAATARAISDGGQYGCINTGVRTPSYHWVSRREICTNGVDDNADGQIDCADSTCGDDPVCQSSETLCDDTFDNDGDGLVDCEDVDTCGSSSSCAICMDIGLLPYPSGTSLTGTYAGYRRDVCLSAGCTFEGYDTDRTNDRCMGIPSSCPDVSLFGGSGSSQEAGRRGLCEAQSCIFTNGGNTAPTGDLCTAPALPAEVCTNSIDDDGDGTIDCADSECADEAVCAVPGTGSDSDVDGNGAVSSADVTFLLYILRAQGDSACGGDGQAICDYSDDGIFACDSGTIFGMTSETDRAHAGDICGATTSGDINGDGVVDSSDVTFLLYILRAQGDSVCGGSGQVICDYSDDGIFACDSGTIYGMTSETDRTHASDTCS